ncbi:MAG: class I SAM-dependent methyltransferase [Gammaproteobacteria bacterium]|nr:class I SAM-dependent methyltransferase [Gammaproteobacteria bacterium]MDH5620535.1 class I SAM-dependent methyltransferase [Gammaproteobacteria bacterium]
MSGNIIPALRFNALTRFYDPVVRLTTRERLVKGQIVDAAKILGDTVVLDLGCGTGTLTVMAKQQHPDARVIGLDADPAILDQARQKAIDTHVEIEFIEANASDIPLPDNSLQCVISSLFFHHLLPKQKRSVLQEVVRVLEPGGRLYICDWGKPSNVLMRMLFYFVQGLDGFATTQDSVEGRLPGYIREAGAGRVREHRHVNTVLGTLRLIEATK